MALNVAVQMDPIESINIKGDSTFAMMLEAQARGHSALLLPDARRWRWAAAASSATGHDVDGARRGRQSLHAGRGSAASISASTTWC